MITLENCTPNCFKDQQAGSPSIDGGCKFYEYIHYQFLVCLNLSWNHWIAEYLEKLKHEYQTTTQNLIIYIDQLFQVSFYRSWRITLVNYIFSRDFKVCKKSSIECTNTIIIQCLDIAWVHIFYCVSSCSIYCYVYRRL